MKHKLVLLTAGVLTLALLLSACAPGGEGSAETAYQKITAEEGRALMDGGSVTVVDVRRADEYEAGHIPGAFHVANEDIQDAQPAALPDLDAALVVYCRTGVRSQEAANKLADLGYTNVMDMGGIVDWPYDTVTGGEPGTYVPAESPEQAGVLSSFTATDLEGNEVDQSVLADYDLTLVNVWATFCGPCLREMPDLGELAGEYENVQFIGLVSDTLNSDGSLSESQIETARDIVAQTGADYLHLLPSSSLMGLLSQIYAVPTTFFVDQEGRQVGSTYMKSMSKEEWIKVIDQVLAEAAEP